ncbi:MAG: hypothetical protein FE044_02275 [Thermoplasmata archaeon]|nr:MAG: hypothetical protein FE044_02275 [Thermoplasmata archaeon]
MEEMFGVEELKENFDKILEEIDSIVRGSYKEKEALEKLRKLLSREQIERFEEMMDSMKKRLEEAEDRAMAALAEGERYKNELEKEQTRLEKLWDAYKKQEDELMEERRRMEELEEEIRAREEKIEKLMKDIEAMEELKEDLNVFQKVKSELDEKSKELSNVKMELAREKERRTALEKEVEELKQYIPYKKQAEELQEKVKELEPYKAYEKYKERFEEMESLYRKEQERLAKLYKLYEETKEELEKTKEKLQKWEDWYKNNKEFIEMASKAFSSLKLPE